MAVIGSRGSPSEHLCEVRRHRFKENIVVTNIVIITITTFGTSSSGHAAPPGEKSMALLSEGFFLLSPVAPEQSCSIGVKQEASQVLLFCFRHIINAFSSSRPTGTFSLLVPRIRPANFLTFVPMLKWLRIEIPLKAPPSPALLTPNLVRLTS